ncbi:MAG: hypothetical protein A2504_00340 [Bdellovibrionales bacterium RIFOXYD12_FULL_39_22]|nr:MAG: hypothetical protein A2385_13920 [Bdellovibrionales bacterium RIFOXYB1_FULL_39_21]OFZ42429.1 MAG: hypothetical protein A2485_03970 [Bdellovibrionales bacterium RIFOXYC12_FULL_39_17]OFZ45405.1 MAG: hypothetical protein A2404_01410 [Bdellovibrionales bacterium RIFOXYC1_FULL_39_130]OFZ74602.1 MAG: hypothetical protein A2560_09440 [Bdellovibrionales bacterium RIFOXYD1_FULL_39_84]OFZ92884.1 MAG: hypothetical protein A2504_00340 [Bdellovibrionales bacterium RIFOXYD12_FULL_39_22]HLE12829.1 hy
MNSSLLEKDVLELENVLSPREIKRSLKVRTILNRLKQRAISMTETEGVRCREVMLALLDRNALLSN